MSGALIYTGMTASEGFRAKLTTTSATVIAGNANSVVFVPWLACTEITGGTPTLQVEIYDGTTSYYLRHALAMTANQTYIFEAGIALNKGDFLRVTAGTANQIDVIALRTLPNTQS